MARIKATPIRPGLVVFLGLLSLILMSVLSLAIDKTSIPLGKVLHAIAQPDMSDIDHILVNTTRLARTAVAIVVGASLAVAGGLMQALTRNPVASPGLFGINAGAVFFIVLLTPASGADSITQVMQLAFIGATLAGALVLSIGMMRSHNVSQLRLVLAGIAVTALLSSFTQTVLIVDQDGLDNILFWIAGSAAGRGLDAVQAVSPYLAAVFAGSLLLARHINILVAGELVARALGQNTLVIRILLGMIVIVLAGTAVALAGNIAFIGLIAPHLTRGLLPNDFRWLIPGYAIFGALLLLTSDMLARTLLNPQEMPLGVVTACLGAPFFIHLARRGMRNG